MLPTLVHGIGSHCRGVLGTLVILTNVQRTIYVQMVSHRVNGDDKLRQQRGTMNNGEDICFVKNGYHQCTDGKSPPCEWLRQVVAAARNNEQ